MKAKTKEMHLIISIISALIIGIFLGQYFGLQTAQDQCNFNAEQIEKCNYENWIYQDICGDIDFLMDDFTMQECIIECTNP